VRALAFAAVLLVGCVDGGADDLGSVDASVDARVGESKPPCDPKGNDCGADQYCNPTTKKCTAGCSTDAGCTKGRCEVTTHTCVDCLGNGDCRPEEICVGKVCVAGCTPTRACPDGLSCCGGGCIDPTTNLDHCGACGKACVVSNGTPACNSGKCAIAGCSPPFENCDGDQASGCETNTDTSGDHCGGCGKPCKPNNASGGCVSGVCKIASCTAGFGDCNGNPSDGCETNLATDPSNCGACGSKPTESCNLRDDDCNGKCDDLDGCRVAVHRSSSGADHFYTTSASEAACCGYAVETLNYYYLYSSGAPDTVPFYRCYNKTIGRHFYTTSGTCEAWGVGALEAPIGNIATAANCGSVPLYRLLSPTGGDHIFTIDPAERAALLPKGWKDEGIAGYVWRAPRG